MFGIGLPEMIVIFAVALIVVGPDKLPGLARSLAKGMLEMKRTLNQVKESLTEEGEELDSVRKELKETADHLREKVGDNDPAVWQLPEKTDRKDTRGDEVLDLEPVGTPSPADPEALADLAETAAEPDRTGEEEPAAVNAESAAAADQAPAEPADDAAEPAVPPRTTP